MPEPTGQLPTPPNGPEALDLLSAIYGCLDLARLARLVKNTLPELVGACGIRVCLHEFAQAQRCWTGGT